jgi:hypothetical protein
MITKIDCYLSIGCGAEEGLRENASEAIRLEESEAEVNIHRIDDLKAKELGLNGSPTIFIGGIELQPQKAEGFS